MRKYYKQKLINEKVSEGLKRNDLKTPKFYLQPKIYKEGNPGCQEVSPLNCNNANILQHVD